MDKGSTVPAKPRGSVPALLRTRRGFTASWCLALSVGGVGCDDDDVLRVVERTVTLTVQVEGFGEVRTEGRTCAGRCTWEVEPGRAQVLRATPTRSGSSFARWGGACEAVGRAVSCELSPLVDTSVQARFDFSPPPPDPTEQPLQVTLSGPGMGVVRSSPAGLDCPDRCVALFEEGTAVVLTASAAAPSTFEGWNPEGPCAAQGGRCEFSLTSSAAVDARFAAPPEPHCRRSTARIVGDPVRPTESVESLLTDRGLTVTRDSAVLTDAALEPYDVVIVDFIRRGVGRDEGEALARWVEGGGGVISLAGHDHDEATRARVNTLLDELGLAYVPPIIRGAGPVTSFAPHPITQGLGALVFEGGYSIEAAPTADLRLLGEVDARPVLGVLERGQGRVIIFGDEWVSFRSETETGPDNRSFWENALNWLCGPR